MLWVYPCERAAFSVSGLYIQDIMHSCMLQCVVHSSGGQQIDPRVGISCPHREGHQKKGIASFGAFQMLNTNTRTPRNEFCNRFRAEQRCCHMLVVLCTARAPSKKTSI
jgi:hypothetical protein